MVTSSWLVVLLSFLFLLQLRAFLKIHEHADDPPIALPLLKLKV